MPNVLLKPLHTLVVLTLITGSVPREIETQTASPIKAFITAPADVTVLEGYPAVLNCKIRHKVHTCQWFYLKEGLDIFDSKSHPILVKEFRPSKKRDCSIRFSKARINQSGQWLCKGLQLTSQKGKYIVSEPALLKVLEKNDENIAKEITTANPADPEKLTSLVLPNLLLDLQNLREKLNESEKTQESLATKFSLYVEESEKKFKTLNNLIEFITNNYDFPNNCDDLHQNGDRQSGVRTIFPIHNRNDSIYSNVGLSVYCDQTTSGGGWTVIQRREDLPVRENFFRTWEEYEKGFGDRSGEFWLGLETLHQLTSSTDMELMVTLEAEDGQQGYAKYHNFSIGNAAEEYILRIDGYSGDAGDSLKKRHNGRKFTTKDRDNDKDNSGNCALNREGAWWYDGCSDSNLNGPPIDEGYKTIHWNSFVRGASMKRTSMMVRPIRGHGSP